MSRSCIFHQNAEHQTEGIWKWQNEPVADSQHDDGLDCGGTRFPRHRKPRDWTSALQIRRRKQNNSTGGRLCSEGFEPPPEHFQTRDMFCWRRIVVALFLCTAAGASTALLMSAGTLKSVCALCSPFRLSECWMTDFSPLESRRELLSTASSIYEERKRRRSPAQPLHPEIHLGCLNSFYCFCIFEGWWSLLKDAWASRFLPRVSHVESPIERWPFTTAVSSLITPLEWAKSPDVGACRRGGWPVVIADRPRRLLGVMVGFEKYSFWPGNMICNIFLTYLEAPRGRGPAALLLTTTSHLFLAVH